MKTFISGLLAFGSLSSPAFAIDNASELRAHLREAAKRLWDCSLVRKAELEEISDVSLQVSHFPDLDRVFFDWHESGPDRARFLMFTLDYADFPVEKTVHQGRTEYTVNSYHFSPVSLTAEGPAPGGIYRFSSPIENDGRHPFVCTSTYEKAEP